MKEKIAIAIGTRPEIIKMAPIIRELQNIALGNVEARMPDKWDTLVDTLFDGGLFDTREKAREWVTTNVKDIEHATKVAMEYFS